LASETYKFLSDLINTGRYVDWADEAHETWRQTKESQGWHYGPERDSDKKTNPMLVPFEELPAEARGQNSLTPYAVVNFFRLYAADKSLAELDALLAHILDGQQPNLLERLGEYIHSHFLAAQLAKGDTVDTRDDMIVYEALAEDTKSWDKESALEVMRQVRETIAK
jgi:hypothetical protein